MWRGVDVRLTPGDMLHAVNDCVVSRTVRLRAALDEVAAGGGAAPQLQREGWLRLVAFQVE
jgi:hypothetical protein